MPIRTTDDVNYSNIANAIRAKLGVNTKWKPGEMDDAIASIPMGEPDWTQLGYESAPSAVLEGFDYGMQIKNTWDASVINRKNAFRDNNYIRFFPIVDTSNIVDASLMFNGSKSLTAVEGMVLTSCTDADHMFNACSSLGSAKVGPFKNNAGVDGSYMFIDCRSLTNVEIDCNGINDASHMFGGCYSLSDVDISNTNIISNAGWMFEGAWWITTNINLNLPQCLTCECMFINSYQYNLEATAEGHKYGVDDPAAVFDITLNIPLCTNLHQFCYGGNVGNGGLKSVHLTTSSHLDTLYDAFGGGLTNLKTIEISDTTDCSDFRGAFAGCSHLVNLSTLSFAGVSNTNKLQNMFSSSNTSFSDDSLIGILQACISCPALEGTKTLRYLGLSSSYDNKIPTLQPYYDTFYAHGWRISS